MMKITKLKTVASKDKFSAGNAFNLATNRNSVQNSIPTRMPARKATPLSQSHVTQFPTKV